jgi:flagellar hook-associated protein 3 FlgL
MRVTDNMLFDHPRAGLAAARERASAAQRVAATGLRVEKPSDDPTSAGVGRRKQNEVGRIEAMLHTANVGAFALAVVDDTFAHMSDLASRAKELAVQAANDTLSAADRAGIALEIASLRDGMLAAANTRVDGKYVLGGLREDAPPFDAAGNFTGDRSVREVEVAPGLRVATSVPAGEVLAPAGGLDVLAALDRLAVALSANDLVGIRAGVDEVGTAEEQILSGRAEVGASTQRLEQAQSLATRMRDAADEARANAVEADAFDALSELTRSQSVLEQAVAIAAKLPLPGLAQRG